MQEQTFLKNYFGKMLDFVGFFSIFGITERLDSENFQRRTRVNDMTRMSVSDLTFGRSFVDQSQNQFVMNLCQDISVTYLREKIEE